LQGSNTQYTFSDKGITWSTDKNKFRPTKYKPGEYVNPPNFPDGIDVVNNERFQVWMRTAGLPTFRKIYGVYKGGKIPAGMYEISITNNYDVDSFKGKKSLVLSTTSWVGSKNPFLGIAYLVVGSLCLILGFGFLARHLMYPRKLGDHTYLSWNQPSNQAQAPAAGNNLLRQ
jgi:hypothetical protein